MEPMKNFCGLIPESIHMRVMAEDVYKRQRHVDVHVIL